MNVTRIPLRRFEDERGWFMELMRAGALPKPVRQSNLVFSRRGVIRALHYHERGQDDLFACVQGTYEYHAHPSHLEDDWARCRNVIRLPDLLDHLLRKAGL